MSKKMIIPIISIVILGVLYAIPLQSGIQLDVGREKNAYFFPWDSSQLTIGWRHSVELTSWEETYDIAKDGELSFSSTVYKAYGAGTPDTEGEVEFLSDGYVKVTGIERVMPSFSLYYVPISKYYLKDDADKYYLKDYVPPYSDVVIYSDSLNIYEWLWLKVSKYLL